MKTRRPDNLRVLFPDVRSFVRATASAWAGSADGKPVRVRQGLLAAPPFGARAVWTSAEIEGQEPGQPDESAAPRGLALLDAMAAARVGGAFWATARMEGRPILACLPADAGKAARMRAALSRRYSPRAVQLLDERPVDPWPLLDACEEVHVADETPLALLAMAAGRCVVCHAPVALSGWGVTDDWIDSRGAAPARGRASIGALAARRLLGARYADPFHDRPCTPEEVIAILADWRRMQARKRGVASVAGIALWKRRQVRALLDDGNGSPPFARSAAHAMNLAARAGGAVLAWPSAAPQAAAHAPAWRIEDGFVRSAGLGVQGVPPCSVVVDRRGIYYDPAAASDLEVILSETEFTPRMLARAAALRDALVRRGISKYNVGGSAPVAPRDRRTILVPGQVTDDASVLAGGCGIATNLELLRRVREGAPDAFIIYKPHPDVASGHRKGALRRTDARRLADLIVTDVAMPALLGQVEEVHTLTSLAGFEALLRSLRVVTYGQPFYAGWGLTQDVCPVPRRTRRLTLAELVAGALILYPLYIDPQTLLPCPVEVLVERLGSATSSSTLPQVRFRQALGFLRRMRRGLAAGPDWC